MDVERGITQTTRPMPTSAPIQTGVRVADPESGWAPPGSDQVTAPRSPVLVTPVETMPPVQHVDVARTVTSAEITPAAIAAGLVSLALLVIGGVTMARAGLDRPLDQPVVEIAGFNGTAVLGIIEAAFGVLLLACAVARSRQATLFIAALGLAGALVAYFQPDVGDGVLGIERSGAAIGAAAMAFVVVMSLLPAVRRTSARVTQR